MPNMHIGINMSGIVESTGLDRYGQKLIDNLKKKAPDNTYICFKYGMTKDHRNLMQKVKNNIWEQIVQPVKIITERIDILHSIKNSGLPILHNCKCVLTICDVIPLLFQNYYLKSEIEKTIYLNRLKISANVADRIIFLNNDIVKDVRKFVYIPDEKIAIIPLGIDEHDNQKIGKNEISSVKNKYNIADSHFILGLGSNEPRKNNITLIKSFVELKISKRLGHYKLVIVGRKWNNTEFDTYMSNLSQDIKKDIILTGQVEQKELEIFYREADVFVFPSLYEGFGLPPLEAMSYGTPVITSNIPVISDVVGDAAIKIDPLDIKGISYAIEKIISNKQLRFSIVEKGYRRIKLFSWEKTAKLTLDLYEDLYKKIKEN